MREAILTAYLSHAHNTVNPETRGPALVIINGIFLVIATVFLSLRVYCRITITKSFGWDDMLVFLGYTFMVGLTSVVILAEEKFYW
jgi:hypothetical protein